VFIRNWRIRWQFKNANNVPSELQIYRAIARRDVPYIAADNRYSSLQVLLTNGFAEQITYAGAGNTGITAGMFHVTPYMNPLLVENFILKPFKHLNLLAGEERRLTVTNKKEYLHNTARFYTSGNSGVPEFLCLKGHAFYFAVLRGGLIAQAPSGETPGEATTDAANLLVQTSVSCELRGWQTQNLCATAPEGFAAGPSGVSSLTTIDAGNPAQAWPVVAM